MGPVSIRSKQDSKKQKPSWITTAPGLILLNSSFAPIAFNPEGAAILTYPKRSCRGRFETPPIPPEILEEIRAHRLTEVLSVVIPFQAGRREYICYVFPITFCCTGSEEPVFALILQRSSSADETVYRVASQFNLTEREREALQGISIGLSSKELATRMRISPNTVKVYLHLVMVKMGVTSRAGIVAKILEQSSGSDKIIADLALKDLNTEGLAGLRQTGLAIPKSRIRG